MSHIDPANFANLIAQAIKMAAEPLAARIKALEAKIATLEAQPKAMQWCGVWRDGGATFEKNDVVTCDGSVWICKQQTTAKPGTDDGQSWQMMLRRARDGRDARR
jgi:hypothetical protein